MPTNASHASGSTDSGLVAAVAVTGWGMAVAFGGSWPWRRGRFKEDRELFRGGLMVNGDVPVALPIELPAGYQVPDKHGVARPVDGPVDATSFSFPPTGKARAKKRLGEVELCVEYAEKSAHRCPTDGGAATIVRTVDRIRVVITLQDHNEANRVAWQTVPLTTDLEKVAWLQ
ncbi:hypothetical protein [Actinopolymorpha pittospori]|uniref:Uncharacterized protein n=2 Tax=Actinopolymorpha pittospori TaxID=648752 RepID=A0A927N5L6_9ACTN|nr:hypothetical protein [Actinopolymorpha pittospori]MBE1608935.1 hypothetical protein [Actinopolymorpha pittospori]